MTGVLPEELHPDLQWDRLQEVAQALVDIRDDVVSLHDPDAGDGSWSLGCRVYERSCNALRAMEEDTPWLAVQTAPNSLAFLFLIGVVPCRFYKGEADVRAAQVTRMRGDEVRQLEIAFPDDYPAMNCTWRFVVETTPEGGPLRVALTRVDGLGAPVADWTLWTRDGAAGVAPVQDVPPPVFDLPPPDVGVIRPASEEEGDESGGDGN